MQIELACSAEPLRLEHQMLVLDAGLIAALDVQHYRSITRRFIEDLLGSLGMAPLGELGIYPAVDKRAPGWSFIQPITTSHVSAHYFEKPGATPHIRLDAYSCESIDWRDLIAVCDRHFALGAWRATFIDREIDSQLPRTILDMSGVGPDAESLTALLPDSRANLSLEKVTA